MLADRRKGWRTWALAFGAALALAAGLGARASRAIGREGALANDAPLARDAANGAESEGAPLAREGWESALERAVPGFRSPAAGGADLRVDAGGGARSARLAVGVRDPAGTPLAPRDLGACRVALFVEGRLVEALDVGSSSALDAPPDLAPFACRFEGLAPGASCTVRLENLPARYLPPRVQRRSHERGARDAASLGTAIVLRGEVAHGTDDARGRRDEELWLDLEPAVHVFGRIADAAGAPVARSHARFHAVARVPGAWVDPYYFDGGDDGWYEGTMYPGAYLAACAPGHAPSSALWLSDESALEHPFRGRTQPRPAALTLAGGESRRVDLAFGGGSATLLGRLVDATGAPCAGFRVLLYASSARDAATGEEWPLGLAFTVASAISDAGGKFRLARLERGAYALVVEPEGYVPASTRPDWKLASRPEPLALEIGDEDEEVVVAVDRARPRAIEGRVTLAPSVAAAHPDVRAVRGELRLLPSARRARERVVPFALDERGAFRVWVESNEGRANLLLSLAEHSETVPLAWDPNSDEGVPIAIDIRIGNGP